MPSLSADQPANGSPEEGICLVLGAGGVRGFAHLGVLERLEEEGIRPAGLVGCSVGGLVASFYAAAGFRPREMLSIGERLSPQAFLLHAWAHWTRRRSLARGGVAGRLLRPLADCSFRRLHWGVRALGITAFDLVRRREILFTGRGEDGAVSVAEAAIGGAAIPLLFPPKRVRCGDRSYRLMDAGFLTPIPVEAALRAPFRAGTVLVVDLAIRFGIHGPRPGGWVRLQERLGPRLIRLRPRVKSFGTVLFLRRDIPALVRAGRESLTPEVIRTLRERCGTLREGRGTLVDNRIPNR